MWDRGFEVVNGAEMKWCVKHFDVPSEEFGMEGGERISKLWISENGKEVACFDRGWDRMPETANAVEMVDRLATIYG